MTHSNAFRVIMKKQPTRINLAIKHSNLEKRGFTLVETLIAGVIMSIVLVAVSRFSLVALTTSHHQSIRRTIESAINKDIQLIQQADSELKLINLTEDEQFTACENPGLFLKEKLVDAGSSYYVPHPDITNIPNGISLLRIIESSINPILTSIKYQIDAPEKDIETEVRFLKIYPNFHYLCDVN